MTVLRNKINTQTMHDTSVWAVNWCQWRHTWLTGETEKYGPVLLPLALIQCELHRLGLVHLALLPARVEPRGAQSPDVIMTSRTFNTDKHCMHIQNAHKTKNNYERSKFKPLLI